MSSLTGLINTDEPHERQPLQPLRVPTVILRRYMTQQVASTTALVLGFLVVMMLGGRLIRYFGIAAEGNLDIGLLFTIIGYICPTF